MGWSTSAPSGVTFSDSTSVTATKTWNHWKLELTVWTARKTNGGDAFYLKVKARWKAGSELDYQSQPGFYWQCTSGSGSADDKEAFYDRPTNAGENQYRYYTGSRGSAADTVTVRLSYRSSYASDFTLSVTPTLAAATYAVTYNANGGSGTTASQTKTYGQAFTTRANGFSRTGYTFQGWNTKADGSGTAYDASTTYPSFPNAAVTLYAQWQIDTYTVSYSANGGTGAPGSQTKTYGVNLTLSIVVPTRTGYTFNGWNTKADGSGTAYAAGGIYTANAAATLYAQWEAEQGVSAWVNPSGTVKQVDKAYANVGGAIKELEAYANVGGVIKKI